MKRIVFAIGCLLAISSFGASSAGLGGLWSDLIKKPGPQQPQPTAPQPNPPVRK